MSNETKLPLVYSCSGAFSTARMANHIAVKLDRLKVNHATGRVGQSTL